MQTTAKLIKEYKSKVQFLDSDLSILDSAIKTCKDEFDRDMLKVERKIKQAQRQCYYQMVEDLKDLEFDLTIAQC